jgi:hypothetical protein
MDEHSSVATAAPIVALTLLLVVGAIALGAHARSRKPALILTLSKKPTSARCIATGWLAMWRLVLSKIPVLRAMCGLQQLVPDIKKQS